MLPGGVLLVLLLVAATARGDSSHDFDWFRTFARDGLPALNKSLREELRRSEQLGLRESLLRAEADLHRAAAADAASAHPPPAAAAQNRERARRQLQRAGRPHEEVADELRDLHERRALSTSTRRSSPSARARRWASPGTRCSSRRSGSPDRSRCPSSAPPRPWRLGARPPPKLAAHPNLR